MRILHLALPILMLAHVSFAQALDKTDAYGGVPDTLIASVGKKDIKEMFRKMGKPDDKPTESNPMLDTLLKQLEEQFEGTGDFLDASLYQEERFGERFSVLTYVMNYANKPIGLRIQMYKGKEGWRASNVNFTPDMDKFVNELRGGVKKK